MAQANKTVVVTGATGSQGGGVVGALLAAGNKNIRAITRSANSSKAKELAAKGVEIAEADLGDKASLFKAFKGADYAFIVTDFFGGANCEYDTELQQGKNAVDAAKEAGVGFVVFSALEDLPNDVVDGLPRLHDGHTISHFQSKHAVGEYLAASGLPYTLLLGSMFYENMLNFTFYQKQPDGSYAFSDNVGNEPHAFHSVGTIGLTAAAVLQDPQKYQGKSVPVVGEHISYPTIAEIISEVTGKTVKYFPMTDEQFSALPIPGAQELANMYSYYRQWKYYDELRPLDKRIVSGPTFKEWAEANKDALKKKLE